jgi:hypothetical protein
MNCALAPAVLAMEDILGDAEKPISMLLVEAADKDQEETVKVLKDSGSLETI